MGSYLASTEEERKRMLDLIGCASMDDLYASVPDAAYARDLDLPEGVSELELRRTFEDLAAKNTVFKSVFRGAGAYNRHIPALVNAVVSNEKFATAYTPYQAEISQGVLQSIFEYQTMVCELTGMDVSNASLYDGAVAAAEAAIMCQERKRSRVAISDAVHPDVVKTMQTYCASRGIELRIVAAEGGLTRSEDVADALGEDAACLLVQQPNYFGVIEDVDALVEAAHAAGAKAIVSADPIALGVLKTPGESGADICVAEGQQLGLPLSFGGPYLGIIAAKKELMRKLPGRIVGQTEDDAGNRCFVLTLQAREQHIRREKASSNVCSNQALCALAAGVYLSCMGPKGLEEVAMQGYSKAHYLADRLCEVDGFELAFDAPFFNEFVTTCPADATLVESRLAERGILGGLPVEGGILWCATEMNTRAQIDELVSALREVVA